MNEVRTVFTATTLPEAHAIRAFLEGEGIECELRGEIVREAIGFVNDMLGRLEVVVAAEDEERARALLASAEHGDFRLSEDEATEDP